MVNGRPFIIYKTHKIMFDGIQFVMSFEYANFEASENGQVESDRLADTLYPADDVSYSEN